MGNSCSVSQSGDSNIGSATASNSLSTLLSTLVPVGVYAAVYFILFLFLRSRFPRYYRPRTFLGSLQEESRTPRLKDGFIDWVSQFWSIQDTYVLNHHTLDGYLFLRFLKLTVVCCVVGCVITWPVLFPINATGGGGHTQLDLLTMANVANYWKYFAHAGCAIIYFTFIIYTITRECIYYINLRQAYLMSPLYASRISSRTVLYTSVPEDYMNESKLRRMLNPGVRRVWLATDCKDLQEKVDERDTAAFKLEAAETKLVKTANGNRLKEQQKAAKAAKKGNRQSSEAGEAVISGNGAAGEESAIGEDGGEASRYLHAKDRPTHRLKFLIGKKVDTIDWCRGELQKLIPEVDAAQASHKTGDAKLLNSVFVEFETTSAAQAAFQSLTHHQVLKMAPRYIGMLPGEVIWSNLRIQWWERVIRRIVVVSFLVALIIFWSIPVAVVGAISNINFLTSCLPWLSFINDIPQVVLGVVTGLLPSVLLAILMNVILPMILRLAAKHAGEPTQSAVELNVQGSFFAFQIVQVFLVATLGSAASSVVQQVINDPSSVTTILAQKLPVASNFFLSYFVLQGLAIVSGLLLGLTGLAVFLILGKFLDNTPRKMYRRWITLTGFGWGTLFPIYTNLFVIAICYAAIAPLVLGFAAIGLFLFYFAYRYNLLFVSNQVIDTKGLLYPRALMQLFIGLYVAEACLIGLFAIATGSSVGAIGPLILMILMLIFTALYHVSLNSAMTPLLNYLPKSLDAEERSLLEAENGHPVDGDGSAQHDEKQPRAAKGSFAEAQSDGEPRKKPNFFAKWLRPNVYSDYQAMRRLVPKEIAIHYTPEVEQTAFFNPAITSETPLLWIPRDNLGVSRKEVADSGKVIPITDDGAYLDEKNKITWDAEDGRPPIYQEKVYY